MQWGNATLTAWSRTQQTVSLNSVEAELYVLTTGIAEGMVTKHLLQELGHEVILMNHVDSQSAKAWASMRGLGRMKHVMLKYMCVQDVVEKKLTNFANKVDFFTSSGSALAMIRLSTCRNVFFFFLQSKVVAPISNNRVNTGLIHRMSFLNNNSVFMNSPLKRVMLFPFLCFRNLEKIGSCEN